MSRKIKEKIRIMSLNFDIPIYPRQIKNFRAAIIEQAMELKPKFDERGININVFLNRDEESDFTDNIYRYPLIQYNNERGKCSIIAINQGIEALQLLLEFKKSTINFDDRQFAFELLQKKVIESEISVTDVFKGYRIYKWLALNSENFNLWEAENDLTNRVELLNKCLHGHINAFLSEVGIKEIDFTARLKSIGSESWAKIKNTNKRAFDVTFMSNIKLPERICLGQHAAFGFGRIMLL